MGLPIMGGETNEERGTASFPVMGEDRGGKSNLPKRGGIRVG